ncbi:uncharacterized protein LTR77_008765 [Saxophila tyrrhenica]|uniref:alpha-1,2-Mannosidase n=1 Tax=Saxophila tyrrhenica TaxID=1690608 RepID=A0AAV9P077_9PEZI|nr:hypothetical protein LTR77_008765 [Saxophila tyrrhenica]
MTADDPARMLAPTGLDDTMASPRIYPFHDHRQDTRDLFYHGFTNYMKHAFPEDEVKPLSCKPLTRNRDNPADIGRNDVLGNYSLTLIDSLSTLAILASGKEDGKDGHNALHDFQDGVKSLVHHYGDGHHGSCGKRACAFDLDSKVQVFETNIRGVGGLLSAHLFAVGDLPIRGYQSTWAERKDGTEAIFWNHNRFVYDGQLLRLAYDLATRLLPAFRTETGLPYPRVNLRHGIPFYKNAEDGVCRLDGSSTNPREITETCAAGAGSLVLEFTTLSRLTGDDMFEKLAKQAFWLVWDRRSSINLVAGGIDAESAQWIMPPLSGIGAGIDSFFEYALKSYILLSGASPLQYDDDQEEEVFPAHFDDPNAYLDVWTTSHDAINHHILRSSWIATHPYHGQSDFLTGAPRYNWIDNLSAYFPGLLTLSGHLDEAIESHLLFTALWTRYSALPERWHITPNGGFVDNNFRHWAGRPEFIESTWYLYRATKDPWLLSVGEMVLRDVRRRCWAKCGWASLRDVLANDDFGEGGKNDARSDRMESFFLGETAKYMYLLFDDDHPLNGNGVDGMVFSTEGHPLLIPRRYRGKPDSPSASTQSSSDPATPAPTCDVPPSPLPLTISNIAARPNLFHPSALTNLHNVPINPARSSPLLPPSPNNPSISASDIRSPTNYTFYPWTLTSDLIPPMGFSRPIWKAVSSTLTFPDLAAAVQGEGATQPPKGIVPLGALQKVAEGILVNSLSNVRFDMVQEPAFLSFPDGAGVMEVRDWRVSGIANWALGRDERVLVREGAMEGLGLAAGGGEHFRRVRDLEWVDLVLDVPVLPPTGEVGRGAKEKADEELDMEVELSDDENDNTANATLETLWSEVERLASNLLSDLGLDIDISPPTNPPSHPDTSSKVPSTPTPPATLKRTLIPAILPTGPGAAPLPPSLELTDLLATPLSALPLSSEKIFFLDSTLCTHILPGTIARKYSVLVIRRGGCSFGEKLANIPVIPSGGKDGLRLVVVLDDGSSEGLGLIRPLLDEIQRSPKGLVRREGLGMVLVGAAAEEALRAVAGGGGWDDGGGEMVEMERKEGGRGKLGDKEGKVEGRSMGVKRRYWFESQGVRIGNLVML